MNKYTLDWTQFSKGFQEKLHKSAAALPGWALRGMAGARSIGKEIPKTVATQAATEGVRNLFHPTSPQFPGAGGAVGGFPFNFSQMLPQAQYQPMPQINLNVDPASSNILANKSEVGSLSNPVYKERGLTSRLEDPNYGFNILKRSDVVDLVIKNLQHKATNSVIDNIMQPEASGSVSSKEELEIVTKHPEMEEVLKDPKNREYLEKLLTR